MSTSALYAEGRRRISELVSGLGEEEAATPVPACPEWSVHDVVAHLTGVCADILGGNLDGVATDHWTAAQVEARRNRTIDEVVAEWSQLALQVEAMADNFGAAGNQLVADLTTHEHDVRGALGRPGARDSGGVMVAVDFLISGLDQSITARHLAPLELRAGGRSWTVGGGEPAGRLEAEAFELMRALTGRRSRRQIRVLGWTVDPAPYFPAFQFGPFTTSPTDVEE
jgi:uncharacterized protein (TIGR03083 family)